MPKKIPQQVEKALQLRDIADLKKDISDLKTLVSEGFKGVHDRQDRTNGKVAANTNWRYWIMGGLGVVIAVIVPTFFIVFKEYVSTIIK